MVMAMVPVLSGSIAFAQKLVDLNAASEKELKSIKGVGPTTAKTIEEKGRRKVLRVDFLPFSKKKLKLIWKHYSG